MPRTTKFVALIFLLVATMPSWSQTPDGNTPANDGVCDGLIGGTPGLYGLCVAYCEARDLDEIGDDVSKPSNSKLLSIYDKRKKATDPDMPCVQAPCPCWSNEEISSTTWTGLSSMPRCNITENNASATAGTYNTVQDRRDAAAQVRDNGFRCVYNDQLDVVMREFNISEEELNICHSQVVQLCADLGF